jgi:hypothetical protein
MASAATPNELAGMTARLRPDHGLTRAAALRSMSVSSQSLKQPQILTDAPVGQNREGLLSAASVEESAAAKQEN